MAMKIYNIGGRECWWEETEVPAGAVLVEPKKVAKPAEPKAVEPANKAVKKATK